MSIQGAKVEITMSHPCSKSLKIVNNEHKFAQKGNIK